MANTPAPIPIEVGGRVVTKTRQPSFGTESKHILRRSGHRAFICGQSQGFVNPFFDCREPSI